MTVKFSAQTRRRESIPRINHADRIAAPWCQKKFISGNVSRDGGVIALRVSPVESVLPHDRGRTDRSKVSLRHLAQALDRIAGRTGADASGYRVGAFANHSQV